jgi:hypothetical protein
MKKVTFALGIALLVSSGCGRSGSGNQSNTPATFVSSSLQEDAPYTCLIQSDAERILGQPAQPTERSSVQEGSIVKHKCIYRATSPDPKTGRPSNLYYILELYSDAASAHKAYTGMLTANTRMPAQSTIDNMGDEAWLHSDGENFHLLMFRKGNKMVRIKINKVTPATSLDELQNVFQKISVNI